MNRARISAQWIYCNSKGKTVWATPFTIHFADKNYDRRNKADLGQAKDQVTATFFGLAQLFRMNR